MCVSSRDGEFRTFCPRRHSPSLRRALDQRVRVFHRQDREPKVHGDALVPRARVRRIVCSALGSLGSILATSSSTFQSTSVHAVHTRRRDRTAHANSGGTHELDRTATSPTATDRDCVRSDRSRNNSSHHGRTRNSSDWRRSSRVFGIPRFSHRCRCFGDHSERGSRGHRAENGARAKSQIDVEPRRSSCDCRPGSVHAADHGAVADRVHRRTRAETVPGETVEQPHQTHTDCREQRRRAIHPASILDATSGRSHASNLESINRVHVQSFPRMNGGTCANRERVFPLVQINAPPSVLDSRAFSQAGNSNMADFANQVRLLLNLDEFHGSD